MCWLTVALMLHAATRVSPFSTSNVAPLMEHFLQLYTVTHGEWTDISQTVSCCKTLAILSLEGWRSLYDRCIFHRVVRGLLSILTQSLRARKLFLHLRSLPSATVKGFGFELRNPRRWS